MPKVAATAVVLALLAPAVARGDDAGPLESPTSTRLGRDDLAERPHGKPIDLLRHLAGVYAVLVAGGGQAEQLLVRGFDAGQGTDLAVTVDGVPVNAPGHARGHGYADTHFVIADTVESVALHEGPYAARAGDFATAGVLELRTLDEVPDGGAMVRISSGEELTGPLFTRRLRRLTYRLTGMASPSLARGKALLAAEVGIADGYLVNPARMRRGAVLGKWTYPVGADGELRAAVTFFSGRWADSGLVPEDEVAAGRLGRWSSSDPTGGGTAMRASAQVGITARDRRGHTWHLDGHVVRASHRLFENPGVFLRDAENGDQIEELDDRTAYGVDGWYARDHRRGRVRLGVQARADDARAGLWHDERRRRLDDCFGVANPCNSTSAHMRDVAAYVEERFDLAGRVRLEPGLRLDQLTWDSEDLDPETATSIDSLTATAARARISPKLGVTWAATRHVALLARGAGAFRSNDSRATAAASAIGAIPRLWAGEVGAVAEPGPSTHAALAVWTAWQDKQVVWDVERGAIERLSPTRRAGIDARLRADLTGWLALDASLSWSRATTFGQGGVAWHRPRSHAALRAIGLAARDRAPGHVVFSLDAAHRWRRWEFGLTVENLLDTKWREVQEVGDIRPSRAVDAHEDLLFAPGAPLTALVTVGYSP